MNRKVYSLISSGLQKSRQEVIDMIGWAGVALLLINYVLLSGGLISGDSVVYHGSSLIGSLCIGLQAWAKRNRQPAILNFVFVFVALYAILRILN